MMTSGFISLSSSPFSLCPAFQIWGYLSQFLKRLFLHDTSKGKPEEMGSISAYIFNVLLTSPHAVIAGECLLDLSLSYSSCSPVLTVNGGVVVENLERNFCPRNQHELFALSCSFSFSNPFSAFCEVKKKLRPASEGFPGFVA